MPEQPRRTHRFGLDPAGVLARGSAILFFLTALPVGSGDLAAQERRTVGAYLGWASSRLVGSPVVATDRAGGLSVGAFVDVQTPARVLSVRVEGGYVRRGSVVWDAELDPERLLEGSATAHMLTVPIHAKLGFGVGRLSVYVFAGPTIDLLLSTNCRDRACPGLGIESNTMLAAGAGTGLEGNLGGGRRVGLELRVAEGLNDAFSGDFRGLRNRSFEVRARVGRGF